MRSKAFRPWDIDQLRLFPPSVRDFVPDGHLAHFVRETVANDLDLGAIYATYSERNGHPPYHPAMMVSLLLYSLCRGVYSSRKMEQACVERVDFMAVTAMAKPDHTTICNFRNTHREALSELFVQVLALCRDAGLARMGHVALDGTKVRANASRHKAPSYKRILELEPELAAVVEEWQRRSEATDRAEDEEGGDDGSIPPHVKAKMKHLAQIRVARARLEAAAEEKARRIKERREAMERELGGGIPGRKPHGTDGIPEDRAQSNFTDPESRIMKTHEGFQQSYNAQAAVDAESQVIVAAVLTNQSSDVGQLVPLVEQIEANTGAVPAEVSADAGYSSEHNLRALAERGIRGYVATGRHRHGTPSPTGSRVPQTPLRRKMWRRLRQGGWTSRYRLRKHTVEPVFGQIKECRGFRRFLTRGLERVSAEWTLLCTAHNLVKLAAARG